MTAELDEDRFNMAIRKFLRHVGVTSQREIENLVRSGEVKGGKLKLRMTLSAEGTPLKHVVEETTIIPAAPAGCPLGGGLILLISNLVLGVDSTASVIGSPRSTDAVDRKSTRLNSSHT